MFTIPLAANLVFILEVTSVAMAQFVRSSNLLYYCADLTVGIALSVLDGAHYWLPVCCCICMVIFTSNVCMQKYSGRFIHASSPPAMSVQIIVTEECIATKQEDSGSPDPGCKAFIVE